VHTAEEKAQDRRANRPVHAPLEQQQHQHPPVDVNEPRWRSRTNTKERVREQPVREHGPGSASPANEHNANERTGVRTVFPNFFEAVRALTCVAFFEYTAQTESRPGVAGLGFQDRAAPAENRDALRGDAPGRGPCRASSVDRALIDLDDHSCLRTRGRRRR